MSFVEPIDATNPNTMGGAVVEADSTDGGSIPPSPGGGVSKVIGMDVVRGVCHVSTST